MRNPAKVLLLDEFESREFEWSSIFFECRDVSLRRIFDGSPQLAAENWKTIVHVDVHAYTSRTQQAINVCSCVVFLLQAVAVAKGIYTNNQVEIARQIGCFLALRSSQILGQFFVRRDMKTQFAGQLRTQKILGLHLCRLHKPVRKVRSVSPLDWNTFFREQ